LDAPLKITPKKAPFYPFSGYCSNNSGKNSNNPADFMCFYAGKPAVTSSSIWSAKIRDDRGYSPVPEKQGMKCDNPFSVNYAFTT
jgi:hypothetical protein